MYRRNNLSDRTLIYPSIPEKVAGVEDSHRLRPQSRGNQEHLPIADLVLDCLSSGLAPAHDLHLDAGVLGRTESLAFGTVVVHARLAVLGTVDGVALAELDLAELVELFRLPADEGVVVRVRVGRDERAAPVYPRAEELVVFLDALFSHALCHRGRKYAPCRWEGST